MLQLVKLEMQKHSIVTFIYASAITTIVMLGFIYLFAYVPQFDPQDTDLYIFEGYNNVIKMYGVVHMTVFCVFACIMFSHFIVETYRGKQLLLLFSYPVNQKKIVMAKITAVVLFISLSMTLSNVIIFSIFFATESVSPIVTEGFSNVFLLQALQTTMIMAITASSLSVIATGIGFQTKSVPTTIISGIILCSLFSNIVFSSLGNESSSIIFMILAFIAGVFFAILLMKKVDKLEAL